MAVQLSTLRMNDRGEFFTGATKVNGTTGEETTIGAPQVTFFGDESKSEVLSAANGIFDDLIVKNAITVEGGVNQTEHLSSMVQYLIPIR